MRLHLRSAHARRRSLQLGCVLGLVLMGLSTPLPGADPTEEFSRSAWIERNWLRGVEFSGGLVPRGDWRPPAGDRHVPEEPSDLSLRPVGALDMAARPAAGVLALALASGFLVPLKTTSPRLPKPVLPCSTQSYSPRLSTAHDLSASVCVIC